MCSGELRYQREGGDKVGAIVGQTKESSGKEDKEGKETTR
jgi:hypothetical protein